MKIDGSVMSSFQKISFFGSLALGLGSAGMLQAQSAGELDKKTNSAYLRTDLMFLVHKSDTLGATDFGTESNVTIGTWTGKSKSLGLALSNRNNRTKFAHVDGAIATTWTDLLLSYRLWWFQPYVGVGSCRLVASLAYTDIADGVCTTVGGGVDIRLPLGPLVVVNLDLDAADVSEYRDHVNVDNDVGARREAELGVSIYPKVTWLSILIGYRYRTFQLTIAGAGESETETGPFVGLNAGYDL